MLYKVFLFNYFNDSISKSILTQDFETLDEAIKEANNYLYGTEKSFFLIRKYTLNRNNIIGGENLSLDTGETIYISNKRKVG